MRYPEQPKHHNGCPLCGRPLVEDHKLCSHCELDIMRFETATIYRWPKGERLTPEEVAKLQAQKKTTKIKINNE